MKTKLLTLLAALCCLSALTSCDEDHQISYNLSGEWRGNFGMFYNVTDRRGIEYTYDADETYIKFVSNGIGFASHGYGYQVDFYDFGPYAELYYKFSWDVTDGVITLDYHYDDQLDTRIVNYHLTSTHFTGRFENASSSFALYNLTDWDWSPFTGYNYGYYYGNQWYWDSPFDYYDYAFSPRQNTTPTVGTSTEALTPETGLQPDSAVVRGGLVAPTIDGEPFVITHMGNRFYEGK